MSEVSWNRAGSGKLHPAPGSRAYRFFSCLSDASCVGHRPAGCGQAELSGPSKIRHFLHHPSLCKLLPGFGVVLTVIGHHAKSPWSLTSTPHQTMSLHYNRRIRICTVDHIVLSSAETRPTVASAPLPTLWMLVASKSFRSSHMYQSGLSWHSHRDITSLSTNSLSSGTGF